VALGPILPKLCVEVARLGNEVGDLVVQFVKLYRRESHARGELTRVRMQVLVEPLARALSFALQPREAALPELDWT
jgi:hypothetical protein